MTTTALILGKTAAVIEEAADHLNLPDVDLRTGTGLDDLRAAFAGGRIDHVLMGAGLDLKTRLRIVEEIFLLSETTTVHMKDVASGPQGMLPFVRAVLNALHGQS
ncbi:MAG: hypothetical protein ACLQDY_21730 [Streptosporangiaceae bacterium]